MAWRILENNVRISIVTRVFHRLETGATVVGRGGCVSWVFDYCNSRSR